MNRALLIVLLALLCSSVTTFSDEPDDAAKRASEKLDALAKSLHYPEATNFYFSNPKIHGAQIGSVLYSGRLVTKDDLNEVRGWYAKKLKILEGTSNQTGHLVTTESPGSTRGFQSVQVDNVVSKEPINVSRKRSVNLYTLTRKTDEFIAFVVLSRAKDEDHTHIVLELIPIAD